MDNRTCQYCGQLFTPTHPRQTYCSNDCRDKNSKHIDKRYYINSISPYSKKHLHKSEDIKMKPYRKIVVKIEQTDTVKTFVSLHLALQYAEIKVIEGYNVEICLWDTDEK